MSPIVFHCTFKAHVPFRFSLSPVWLAFFRIFFVIVIAYTTSASMANKNTLQVKVHANQPLISSQICRNDNDDFVATSQRRGANENKTSLEFYFYC